MRKWLLAGLAALAISVAGLSYHVFVVRRNAEHYRGLVEADSAAKKALHYREIFRFYDPFDGTRLRARQWVAENGHEWGLGINGEEEEKPEIIIFYGQHQFLRPYQIPPQYPAAQPSLRQSEPAK